MMDDPSYTHYYSEQGQNRLGLEGPSGSRFQGQALPMSTLQVEQGRGGQKSDRSAHSIMNDLPMLEDFFETIGKKINDENFATLRTRNSYEDVHEELDDDYEEQLHKKITEEELQ
jgi:hypothetical protein